MINPELTPEDEALLDTASQATLGELYQALKCFYGLDENSLEQASVSTYATENTQKLVEVSVNVAPHAEDMRFDRHGRKSRTRFANIKITDAGAEDKLITKRDKLAGDFELWYADEDNAQNGAFFELYELKDGNQELLCSDETARLVRQFLPDAEEAEAARQAIAEEHNPFKQNGGLPIGVMDLFQRANQPPQSRDKTAKPPDAA
jgi:hypothetical protein